MRSRNVDKQSMLFYLFRVINILYLPSLMTKFEGSPIDLGLKLLWGGFRLRDAICRKRCKIAFLLMLSAINISLVTPVYSLHFCIALFSF